MRPICTRDIVIHSLRRKKKHFMVIQTNSGGRLFVDGRNMGPTKHGYGYAFHLVDGKIDHWYKVFPKEFKEERELISEEPPIDWCDECREIEIPIAGVDKF